MNNVTRLLSATAISAFSLISPAFAADSFSAISSAVGGETTVNTQASTILPNGQENTKESASHRSVVNPNGSVGEVITETSTTTGVTHETHGEAEIDANASHEHHANDGHDHSADAETSIDAHTNGASTSTSTSINR